MWHVHSHILWQPNHYKDLHRSSYQAEDQACRDPHALYQGASAWQDHHSTILPDRWADFKHIHQDIFRKEVHLPPFTIGGEFIRVIQLLSVFSLRGWFPTGFSLFSSLSLFLSIVSASALYRVTYGLSFWGPSIFMNLCFLTPPEYSLRWVLETFTTWHTHFGQFFLVKPLS